MLMPFQIHPQQYCIKKTSNKTTVETDSVVTACSANRGPFSRYARFNNGIPSEIRIYQKRGTKTI